MRLIQIKLVKIATSMFETDIGYLFNIIRLKICVQKRVVTGLCEVGSVMCAALVCLAYLVKNGDFFGSVLYQDGNPEPQRQNRTPSRRGES